MDKINFEKIQRFRETFLKRARPYCVFAALLLCARIAESNKFAEYKCVYLAPLLRAELIRQNVKAEGKRE